MSSGVAARQPREFLEVLLLQLSPILLLSHAATELRRGVSSLLFGLQLKHSHLNCFQQFFMGPDSVVPALSSGEVVY